MKSHIRIGNQTAFSSEHLMAPFEYAVANGFDAFEWFADKKLNGDGSSSGWDESDLDLGRRAVLREAGRAHDILFTVHAPWQANPLQPEGISLLRRSVDFARDIGGDLVNLHLYMEEGVRTYVEALLPVIRYARDAGVRISIENTPLTSPEDFARVFARLRDFGLGEIGHVGMCLDIGHANLFEGTRNDYIGYIDGLPRDLPIIHVHVHENWGDRDSHLPLFTGPARDDDRGIRAFVGRLRDRRYRGSMILEQWPRPPELLLHAENRLREMIGGRAGRERSAGNRRSAKGAQKESEPAEPGDGLTADLLEAHASRRSWRQRLEWVRDRLGSESFDPEPTNLVTLAVYLRFLATGEVACEEDGRHFRPGHHATAASRIEASLHRLKRPETEWILRKLYPFLPSYDDTFQRKEPLTRIRDIAHRNDIPSSLKREIKHRLQNKLHRCAGPEDLQTSAELLARIREPDAAYPEAFVTEFAIFHHELLEFFNASGVKQRLESLAPTWSPGEQSAVRRLLKLKSKSDRSPSDTLRLLSLGTELREVIATRLPGAGPAQAQYLRVTDVALEDYAFVLLSEFEATWQAGGDKGRLPWAPWLRAALLAVENLRMSAIAMDECTVIERELACWSHELQLAERSHLLRVKATLERALRVADEYADRVLSLFPPRVESLGRALGVDADAIAAFAEGDIRGNLVFQLAKLVQPAVAELRQRLQLPVWETVSRGRGVGRLLLVDRLDGVVGKEAVVVLVNHLEGDEIIPAAVQGVVARRSLPHLSHLAVRARQAAVPFVTTNDPDIWADLVGRVGQVVDLRANGNDVIVDNCSEPRSATLQDLSAPPLTLEAERVDRPMVVALETARRGLTGAKAANLARLWEHARDSGSFSVPGGIVLPFGVMEACVAGVPEQSRALARLREQLDHAPVPEADRLAAELRDLTERLRLPDGLLLEIGRAFSSETPLAVRSSSSLEDLALMSGAGLHESVVGVTISNLADAVRTVWASLWTDRAVRSRKASGLPDSRAAMAVIIQEMVAPDWSFILHGIDPAASDRGWVSIEMAVGLGETLASARQAGAPYRLRCSPGDDSVIVDAYANFSFALLPGRKGRVQQVRIDYTREPMTTDSDLLGRLGRRLASIAGALEERFGSPQDVEGGIVGEEISVVQTRPQQGLEVSTDG